MKKRQDDLTLPPVQPFNPLEVPSVALVLALEVLEQTPQPLKDLKKFPGVGIYMLYYHGSFDLYAKIAAENKDGACKIPIYVGKGVRKGTRKGRMFGPTAEAAVYDRLKLHSQSIGLTKLSVDNFSFRYLIVEDTFIGLAESVLISIFRPLWNQVVDGFGNNPTGGPRSQQAKSGWDVIHPGRVRGLGAPKRTEKEFAEAIEKHLTENGFDQMDATLQKIRFRIKKYNLG